MQEEIRRRTREAPAGSCRGEAIGKVYGFCPSVRRFALRLLSDIGSPLSPCLRLVLFEVVKMTPSRKMYRGLSPHKIMPMPGTHKAIHPTASVAAIPFAPGDGKRYV